MNSISRFLLVAALAAVPAIAAATTPTLALRVGGVFEGPQHTLTNGLVAGGSVEWPRSFGALGLSLEWAGETGNNDIAGYSSVFHVGALARWEIAAGSIRPFLEGGLGVSHVSADGGNGPLQTAESGAGLGGWIGVGAAMPLSETLVARLDGRYSMLTAEAPGLDDGGNLGDYFSVALSLAFAR